MKQKLSISVEEDTLKEVLKLVEEGKFRNTSHALEYSFKQLIRERSE
jgi:Arc/MetJ-type ribon-helix-helix transcriptional regulator